MKQEQKIHTFIHYSVEVAQKGAIMSKNSTQSEKFPTHKKVDLDELDRKILSYLQVNGKASLRKIKLHLEDELQKAIPKKQRITHSISAIKNHIEQLTKQGVIKDYIAVIDCRKIGYREMILLFIKVNSSETMREILLQLETIDSINAIYQVSGNQPIFCMAKCVEKEDQIALLEEVKTIKGIEEISTQVVLQKIKEDMRVAIS